MSVTSRPIITFVGFILVLLGSILSSYFPLQALFLVVGVLIALFIFLAFSRKPMQVLSFLLCALVLSLFFTPSVSISGASFRVDDVIVVFITIFLMILLFKREIGKNLNITTLKFIIVYLLFSLFITMVRIFFDDLNPIYILFFVKEIQYFIYFLLAIVLIISGERYYHHFQKAFYFGIVITLCWGVFQLLTGSIRGYYGIGIISVQNPSQSGVVFFLMTISLIYFSDTEKGLKSAINLMLAVISMALTIATISRTAILVVVFSISLYLFISLFKRKKNTIKLLVGAYLLIPTLLISYFIIGDMLANVFERLSRFNQGVGFRTTNWEYFLSQGDWIGYIVGNGKGFMQVIVGSFTLKADNQYVRLIVESGVIGLLLWLMIILSILYVSFKNLKYQFNDSIYLIVLTVSFMVIGVTQEGYLVAIQGSLYWIISGVILGKIYSNSQTRIIDSKEESRDLVKRKRIVPRVVWSKQ